MGVASIHVFEDRRLGRPETREYGAKYHLGIVLLHSDFGVQIAWLAIDILVCGHLDSVRL